ncbi:unnamed protein product [Owenia fusiformis]|uniref:Uncharacterized protein n=1 Tax=Owenia fusiformis TaxID=6347 RepID=A0A8J1XSI9_OWEFU|nr:unnamed protein product [Owenia fusiformis]
MPHKITLTENLFVKKALMIKMQFANMELRILTVVFLFQFANADTKSCDYLMVRRSDASKSIGRPTCSGKRVFIFEGKSVRSLDFCLSNACDSNATVVYYEAWQKCIAFKCESNKKNKDWAYNWVQLPEKRHTGQTYALPHSYIPQCYNSYFVKRSWNRSKGLKSKCILIASSTMSTDDLKRCMEKACDDKANALNFYKVQHRVAKCESLHCRWNESLGDINFEIEKMSDEYVNTTVNTYRLSHSTSTLRSCKSAFWNDSIQMSVQVPQCSTWGMFPDNLVEDDHNPPSLCRSGYNTFQRHPDFAKITAYVCNVNAEGTDWKYYDNGKYCFGKEKPTRWLNIPYPGIPVFDTGKSTFRVRYLKGQCKMSNCDDSERVNIVRDLRQCMIYAYEKNYNVINYFSNASLVICDLRNCSKLSNGEYDFKLSELMLTTGYDIYEFYEIKKEHHSDVDTSVSKFNEQMKETIVNIDSKTDLLIRKSTFNEQMDKVIDRIDRNTFTIKVQAIVQTIVIGIVVLISMIKYCIVDRKPDSMRQGYVNPN